MKRDVRNLTLYREAERLHLSLRQPGSGQISDATELEVSPDGRYAAFAGTLVEALDGVAPTRICEVDLESGALHVLTFGPGVDRSPRFSPHGHYLGFLSDRARSGDFQLYLLDRSAGAVRATPPVAGWVEYLQWSPDGSRILLGVAGHGADVSGGQGAVTTQLLEEALPSWVPVVDAGEGAHRRRSAWVYELATHQVRRISPASQNIWEAVWCGNEALVAVVSSDPGEGAWYGATLHLIRMDTGISQSLYAPRDQIGALSASLSGRQVALAEAVCSDRGYVAGELRLIDTGSGQVREIDTRGIDITHTEWRSDTRLLVAGHRALDSVLALYTRGHDAVTELWSDRFLTTGGRFFAVSGLGTEGDCALIAEGFLQTPELAVIRQGRYQFVKSFGLDRGEHARVIESAESVSWEAPDGLEIQGWLLRPHGRTPHSVIMNVHGGPVWHWRPRWLGRAGVHLAMLIGKGHAIFFPNPRGSAGRGQAFARAVLGDMGGADTHDCLSGLDHLVARGIADPSRLGVMGTSYGGFMTAWLITQDPRFAAAVAVASVTNQVTEHLISNIAHFVRLFLADSYTNAGGKYFSRSPVMYAHTVGTPILNICGALDRCTPPDQAVQFHNALLAHGRESALVVYPCEGHGVRTYPAIIDYAARVVGWFEKHMPARANGAAMS